MKLPIVVASTFLVLATSASAQEFKVRPVNHDAATKAPKAALASKRSAKPVVSVISKRDNPKAVAPVPAKPGVKPKASENALGAEKPKTVEKPALGAKPSSDTVFVASAEKAAEKPVVAEALNATEKPAVETTGPAPTKTVAELRRPDATPAVTKAVENKTVETKTVDAKSTESKPAAATAKAPAAMAPSIGMVTFGGNVQMLYLAGSSDVINTFKLRRAELKFVGVVSPTVRWTLMADLAKSLRVANNAPTQSTTPLQDAYITVKAGHFDINAGQFLLPLSYEGSGYSSSLVETTERALFISDGKLGQVRDLGAQIGGKITSYVKFRAGLFNSTGDLQNTTAVTGEKAIVARLESTTPIAGFTVGTSGASAGRDAKGNPVHDRIGSDVEYAYHKFTTRSEFMRAWDGTNVNLGAYALATYALGDVMLVSRYDYWDKDARATTGGADVKERDVVLGFQWQLEGNNVVLRSNYVFRRLDGQPQKDQVTLFLQSAW